MTFLEAQAVLSKIRYKRAKFFLEAKLASDEVKLIIRIPTPSIITGKVISLTNISYPPIENLTTAGFVSYIHTTCLDMESHEVGEWFQYNGIRVYDPHRKEQDYTPVEALPPFPAYENERPKLEVFDHPTPKGIASPYDNTYLEIFFPEHVAQGTLKAITLVGAEENNTSFLKRLWVKLFT